MHSQSQKEDSEAYQSEISVLQKQAEQFTARFQIINSIQHGLARKLGILAIYELVGEKLQEVFPRFDITTFAYDPGSGMITAPFISQRGKRLFIQPFKLQDRGFIHKLLRTQETIVINENFEEEAAKIGHDLVGELELAKSSVYVPLLIADEMRGVVVLRDMEREHAISNADVRFLETVASSMSVALENARLFDEVQRRNQEISEALDQQTATSNVLRALSGFQPDLRSLLEIIAENAANVCGADDAHIYRIEGDLLKQWSHRGPIPGLEAGESLPLSREALIGRAILDRQIIHIRDAAVELTETEYPISTVLQRRWGVRTVLAIPLLRDGEPIGGIAIRRKVVLPFTEKQIELIKTFADQAVIAIENVRLFDETQRLLKETQERNAELAIINSVQEGLASKLNFQEIIDLVGAKIGEVFLADVVGIVIYDHKNRQVEFRYRVEHGERFYHQPRPIYGIFDHILKSPEPVLIHTHKELKAMEAQMGQDNVGGPTPDNSHILLPMLSGRQVIGFVSVGKLPEYAFSESDVRLLQTLANSMSVALDNARLFDEVQKSNRETTEALERETASNDILHAIAESATDIQPVLEVVAEYGARLSESAECAIFHLEPGGKEMKLAAHVGPDRSYPLGALFPVNRQSVAGAAILDGVVYHVPDIEETGDLYPISRETQSKHTKYHALLGVPLMRENQPIGIIFIRRTEAGPFTDKQIQLVKTFADQAVIAIENVRLFDEVRSQRQYLEALLQNSPVAIVVIDLEANVVSWNPSATSLFGYEAAEALGRNVDDLVANNKAVREEAVAYSTRVASKGDVRAMTQRTRKDGTLVDVELLSLPVIVDGEQVGFIAIYHDISEQKRVEEALREQKQYFEALVLNSPVAIVVIDSDGRVFSWNPAAERLFGYAEAESIGNNIDDLVAKNDSVRAEAVGYNRQASRGELVHGVTRRTRKDGTMVDVELVGVPVRVSENNFRFMCMYHDITELKLVDEELRQQKEYFEALVRNSPVAIVAIDLDANVVSWNPVAEKLFGFTESEALGRNVDDLVAKMADQDVQSEAIEFNHQAARGDLIHAFSQRSRKDGTLVDVELLALPVVVDGEQIGIIVIYHDITERKRFEQELRRQKEYFEALVLNNPVAVVAIDQESNVVSWNPAAEKLFGYSQNEAIGRNVDELVANVKAIRHEAVKYSGQASHGDKVHVITRRNRKDGTLLDVELLGLPIIVAGEQVGFIAIYHDITELQRARHEAEAANEAKSAFLANMSHEIRTPMNAVIGMSGLLMDTDLTKEQREYAETIRNSSDTLLTIINDILDFSKIEAGKMELENQPFDLRECVESALDLVAGRAAERGLDLAYILDDEVPSAVRGDVTRLRQILLNLLSNGIKFTEKGEVIVEVKRGRAKDELIFSVRDTGIGISKEGMKRIFQSFSQADSSTTRKYGGTGLGLAISKRLAEMMGGNMWAESAGLSGKGSTFFFTMKAETAKIARGRALNLSGRHPEVEGKRILIVDDNATNCRILELQTQKWGILSRSTKSAKEAMSLLKTGNEFDLAILDMHMPVMDGLELAKEMRSLPQAKKLPLILLTSLGQHEIEAAAAGFVAHLTKPVKPSQLFDAIATVFTATETKKQYASAAKRTKPKLDSTLGERHPLHILLAEDNAVNQKVALRLLDQMGYRADVASNGLEAIESVERQPYDVILMDVQMPEMDGLEATRRIVAARSKESRPYIIAMTANAMQGDREMCIVAGMDDYVTKPINIDELTEALLKAPSHKQEN